ncbi:MAG: D-glycero-beta-D-manno-heptose 1-phosphate adenylyltransferase [Desulfohalobiaceae bacterium]
MCVRDPYSKVVTAQNILENTQTTNSPSNTVFTNGCFDLLHRGHVDYLMRCKRLGDTLIVGMNTDASVRRLKGGTRPVTSEQDRAYVLGSLECVDYVVLFDEDDPLRLIQTLQPDVLVKGGDWSPDMIVGREVVRARGGAVYSLPFLQGYSTSGLIQRISSLSEPGESSPT